jgi:hypothetical protein
MNLEKCLEHELRNLEIMKTITLPFDWNEARNYHSRFVTSLDGFQIDLLNFTKVFLNKKLFVHGNEVSFDSNSMMIIKGDFESEDNDQRKQIIRLSGIGEYKSHVIQNSFDPVEEKILAYFHDTVGGEIPYVNNKLKIRTFGYSEETILNIIEQIGTIYRATKNTFIVLDREDFYKWIGEEMLTLELFNERLYNYLNRNKIKEKRIE